MRCFLSRSYLASPPGRKQAPSPVSRSRTQICLEVHPLCRRRFSSWLTFDSRCHSSPSHQQTENFPQFFGPFVASINFVFIVASINNNYRPGLTAGVRLSSSHHAIATSTPLMLYAFLFIMASIRPSSITCWVVLPLFGLSFCLCIKPFPSLTPTFKTIIFRPSSYLHLCLPCTRKSPNHHPPRDRLLLLKCPYFHTRCN